jgi:hypothetical protein
MKLIIRYMALPVLVALSYSVLAQRHDSVLTVVGHSGEAAIVEVNGHAFVDVRALAQITNSTITFERNRVVLNLPHGDNEAGSSSHGDNVLSREFMRAGIEAVGSMREWGSTLVLAIEHGYPIGDAMTPYKGRAADAVRLASAAAVTKADRSALELLNHEFTNVDGWSNQLVSARNSLRAANYSMSDDAVRRDPLFQNITRCGQFLGPMFASGSFQDDGSCRY